MIYWDIKSGGLIQQSAQALFRNGKREQYTFFNQSLSIFFETCVVSFITETK